MAEIIDLEATSHEIEDVVELPQPPRPDMHGPWEDESLSTEERVRLITERVSQLENDAVVKEYVIDGGLKTGIEIENFLKDRVKWKFTDAFLVVNTYNEIEQALAECRAEAKANNGNGQFKIRGLFIEPLIQMIQGSSEGVGLGSAKRFYDMILVPVSNAVNRFREDNITLQNLRLVQGSLENQLEKELAQAAETEEEVAS